MQAAANEVDRIKNLVGADIPKGRMLLDAADNGSRTLHSSAVEWNSDHLIDLFLSRAGWSARLPSKILSAVMCVEKKRRFRVVRDLIPKRNAVPTEQLEVAKGDDG